MCEAVPDARLGDHEQGKGEAEADEREERRLPDASEQLIVAREEGHQEADQVGEVSEEDCECERKADQLMRGRGEGRQAPRV